jgi:hypothetical protein
MTQPRSVELTPEEAATLIHNELARASAAFRAGNQETGLSACTSALGLGLQLGPSPAGQILLSLLEEAHSLALRREAATLSALGPALIRLVADVRNAGALAPDSSMVAWANVAEEVGALVGQVGLVLTVEPQGRAGMLAAARRRAERLDEAMRDLFDLVGWLESMDLDAT